MSDSPTLIGVVFGVGWFAAFLVCHILLFHLREIKNRFSALAKILLGSLGGHLATAALLGHLGRSDYVILIATGGIGTLGSLWVLHMPFYYVVASSTSMRTLIELNRTCEGAAPLHSLHERFASADFIRSRPEILVAYGSLAHVDEGFTVNPEGRPDRALLRGSRSVVEAW